MKNTFNSSISPTVLSGGTNNITFTYAGFTNTVSRAKLNAASEVSLDEDIALMRVIIAGLLRNDPDNIIMLLRAVELLASLISLRAKDGD